MRATFALTAVFLAGVVHAQEITANELHYRLSVLSGMNWPHGDFQNFYDPSTFFAVQIEHEVTPRLGTSLEVGYNEFSVSDGGANLGMMNLSFVAHYTVSASHVRPFFVVGPGAYRTGSTWRAGLQGGIGLEVPLSNQTELLTGFAVHRVAGDAPNPRWMDAYVGFRFRIP